MQKHFVRRGFMDQTERLKTLEVELKSLQLRMDKLDGKHDRLDGDVQSVRQHLEFLRTIIDNLQAQISKVSIEVHKINNAVQLAGEMNGKFFDKMDGYLKYIVASVESNGGAPWTPPK